MNKDQVKGRFKEAKGRIKEATGKIVGSANLEAKGKLQKIAGHVQATYGDAKKEVKEIKRDMRDPPA